MFLSWSRDIARRDYQFVVIGAGPVGLYLAQLLAVRGKVLVVEAGNAEDTFSTGDDIYRLVSTGRDYPTTGTRLLAFGGTSNHWGGHSRPLSPEAFGKRSAIPGWPIAYEDFAQYLDAARAFLNLPPFETSSPGASIVSGMFGGHEHLLATQFHYASPAVRLGEADRVSQWARSDMDILTDTRLSDLELSTDGSRVQSISVVHRPSGETASLAVRQVFLCAGGIENPRMMLWAGRKYPAGNPLVGGPNQLTGTHFLEKPYFWPVDIYVDARADLSGATFTDEYQTDFCWELSADFRKQHDLPRFGVFPGASRDASSAAPALERGSEFYALEAPAYVRLEPAFQFEQTPHAGSYVKLSDELDAHGVALPELHWEISATDVDAYRRATLLFCGVLSQSGVARCRLGPGYLTPDWADAYIGFSNHHTNTTRMGANSLEGVVDGNCRVFGLDNLFVAGSSVFPSSDYVNPTLNVVALAGRLADHVIRTAG